MDDGIYWAMKKTKHVTGERVSWEVISIFTSQRRERFAFLLDRAITVPLQEIMDEMEKFIPILAPKEPDGE